MSARCRRCEYALVRGACPICDGRQASGLEPVGAIVPRAMRAFFVVEAHFESPRHYRAWCAGIPIRSERKNRWKVPAKVREQVMRHFGRRCQWPRCGDTDHATIEHIVPVAFGGSNHPGNLTVLCPTHQRASWQRFQALLSPNAVQTGAA